MRSLLIRILSLCLGISYQCLAAPRDYISGRNRSASKNTAVDLSIGDVIAEVGEYPKPQDFPSVSMTSPSPSYVPKATATAASISQTLSTGKMDFTASSRLNMPHEPTRLTLVPLRISEHRRRRSVEQHDPIVVVFSILGAFIGVIVLILCGRSICHYYRTPRRNLIQDHIDRYNLERELAEIEWSRVREIIAAEESIVSPPPPYLEEVPKYEGSSSMKQAPPMATCPR